MTTPLAERIKRSSRAVDASQARRRLAELMAHAGDGIAASVRLPPVRALLMALADHSPFLWGLARADPPRLARLLATAPETSLAALLAPIDVGLDEASLMRRLRRDKQELALLVALCDLGLVWDLATVTYALSDFADRAVATAFAFALRQQATMGRLVAEPEVAGAVVLALGKHGARALNYSSDVDLMVFFDPESAALAPGVEPSRLYVAAARALVRLLQERTADGYVLRVDLRLRPDPGSTAIALALPSAYAYYESVGQNWERAALIKARPVAGELALGDRLIADLAPFIWRKYFDYAAIADIHAMKRQIHAVRGHADVTVAGHDVKLGRGGIREVEFFVQTQQLIFGGRRPRLRGARTLDMLRAIHEEGWIDRTTVEDLSAAYDVLRRTEHRLQMIADEQTQRLPMDDEALARFAALSGYPSLQAFSQTLVRHLRAVERHYARLFEHAPELSSGGGDLVFTGVEDDPATLATLASLGYLRPSEVIDTVRGWHFGRRPAVRSARAREVLTELVPALLETFAGTADPDGAVRMLDAALSQMPAAVELFTLLRRNAALRGVFGDILGSAPRLARAIVARPHLLDALIDPAFFDARPHEALVAARIAGLLPPDLPPEDFLDRVRDVAREETFLVGARLLSAVLDPEAAGRAYSHIAALVVAATLDHIALWFSRDHGLVAGGRCAVLAMGRLGSREMNAASDLDLIVLYDFDAAAPYSHGARPLHAVQYYTRLTQRLVSALTVATRRGRLYEIDLRLRPSGQKGPVAVQMDGFVAYQREEAEPWEHMALTRARAIAGDPSIQADIASAIHTVLAKRRDPRQVMREAVTMRRLIAAEKGEANGWDLKLAAGGLLDIEFIAQALVTGHAADVPALLVNETEAMLRAAADAGLLTADDADQLLSARRLYADVLQVLRLALDPGVDPSLAGEGVRRRVASAGGLPDFATLSRELEDNRTRVRAVFDCLA